MVDIRRNLERGMKTQVVVFYSSYYFISVFDRSVYNYLFYDEGNFYSRKILLCIGLLRYQLWPNK